MLLTPRDEDERRAIPEGEPLPPSDRLPSVADVNLDTLYRRQRARFLRFFGRTAASDAAQDLYHQLFVRLAGREDFRPIENPDAYLQRSATNLASDNARKERRMPQFRSFSDTEIAGPDQLAALEARDMLRRLEAAIAKLNPRTREIFLAHRFDGLSYREIAGRTGLSLKAVEKHMSRAIAYIDRLSR